MDRIAFWWGSIALWSMIPALTAFLAVSLAASNWRSSRAGVAVLMLMAAWDLVLITGMVWILIGADRGHPAGVYVRAVLYTALGGAVWWLLVVLLRIQYGARAGLRKMRLARHHRAGRQADKETNSTDLSGH